VSDDDTPGDWRRRRGRLRLVTPGWDRAYKAAVGRRLRELREERGLTQAELARRAGVSNATLCFLESGETQPLPATQRALAAALGLELGELLARLTGDPHAR
jgi:DNA-binding XRE family transcriptional regulator